MIRIIQSDITQLHDESGTWLPTRTLLPIEGVVARDRLDSLSKQQATVTVSDKATNGGAVKQLLSVSATESPVKMQDRTLSQVSVNFTRDPSDASFAGARIWFKGYHGNADPQLMAQVTDSPMGFLCESTGESVTVIAQAVSNSTAANLDLSPTTVVLLDGVISAPPAPAIAQSLTTVTNGFQFRFNFIPHSASDAIDGYWVYRNDVDDSSTATHYKYVKHPDADLSGGYTYQDIVGVGIQYFYWVSAVNKSGLESTKTAAQAAAGGGGGTPVTSNAGTTVFRRPTTSTGSYSDAAKAYDNDESTPAFRAADGSSHTHEWSGFGSLPSTPTSLKLKVVSLIGTDGFNTADLDYSLNGGASWLAIYHSADTVGAQPDVITLSTTQDPTQVKVRATTNAITGTFATHYIYEIWLEAVL